MTEAPAGSGTRLGVLLMTYGSPESLDDMPRYLAAVRGGREPSPDLVEEFRRRYEAIGGSPLIPITAAQAAAVEALKHEDEVTRRVELNLAERGALEAGLRALGLDPAESHANFLWFDLPEDVDEPALVATLAERGVLVRSGRALGREGALRVTVGREAENERFLTELRSLL